METVTGGSPARQKKSEVHPLKALRKKAGLTQQAMADRLIIYSRESVGAVERGQRRLQEKTVLQCERVFGERFQGEVARLRSWFESQAKTYGYPRRPGSVSPATGLSLIKAPRGTKTDAGIRIATLDFYRGIPWDALYQEAKEVDLLFTYARTWRRTLAGPLDDFFKRKNTVARVVLPDYIPPNNTALPEIAKRAGQTVDVITEKIVEGITFFSERGAEIWLTDTALLYTSYRFDDAIVWSIYNFQRGEIPQGLPTLLVERGGSFFEFFAADFAALTNEDVTRPMFSRRVH